MTHRPTIIKLCGYSKAGKNFVAHVIHSFLDRLGYKVIQLSFARALKEELGKIMGLTLEDVEDNKENFRPALIELGSFVRSINVDYWRDITYKEAQLSGADFVIITDCRKDNELQGLGARLWISPRPGYPVNKNDGTEIRMEDCDATLINSDYPGTLVNRVMAALQVLELPTPGYWRNNHGWRSD